MTVPNSRQTVHLMTLRDVRHVRRAMRRDEGRNTLELKLYTTDDLRRLYQETSDDSIRLRDGIVSRAQLVAEIQWRVYREQIGYGLLLFMTVIGAVAAVIAAVEGWK